MLDSVVQKAIFAALTSASCCGGRVYDTVPKNFVFPYITIGDEQVIDDTGACGEAYEVYCDVHVWSRPDSGSRIELKAERQGAVAAIRGIASITGWSLDDVSLETSRSLTDPDGLTKHEVLTFKFLISEA